MRIRIISTIVAVVIAAVGSYAVFATLEARGLETTTFYSGIFALICVAVVLIGSIGWRSAAACLILPAIIFFTAGGSQIIQHPEAVIKADTIQFQGIVGVVGYLATLCVCLVAFHLIASWVHSLRANANQGRLVVQ